MGTRRADLNLFAVFSALERERSVTRAAEALGLSQPAVSHALARLRDLYGDQLFARTASGMEPTPRARELADTVRDAVAQLQGTVEPDAFDAATSRDRIVLAMDNYATIVLAARLATSVAAGAPQLRLAIRPSGTLDLAASMRRGVIDLAVGARGSEAGRERHLLSDRYVAVMRRAHPAAANGLDCPAFAAADHLEVSSVGEHTGFVDVALARRGLSRTIRLEAPYIATAALLATSDMVGVVAERIAVALCQDPSLVWRELPFETPAVKVGMVWPPVLTRRASHRWLRGVIAGLVADDGGRV